MIPHLALRVLLSLRERIEVRVVRNLKRVKISDRELRLVVEHLFEVRHVPVAIDRVAMKTAAELIVHSAGGHFAQRDEIHFESALSGFTLRIACVKAR